MIGRTPFSGRSVWIVVLCVVVLVSMVATAVVPVSAQSTTDDDAEGTFVADIDEDGDADLRLVTEFDLTTDSERAAFQELQSDEDRQEQLLDEYQTRMDRIATRATDDVDREIRASDPRITVETNDEETRGVVTLAVRWSSLAEVNEDKLIVEEPFASGFQFDGDFVVSGPEGYMIDGTTPEPDTVSGNTAQWSDGTDLSTFSVVLSADGSGEDGGDASGSDSQPGFGILISAVALGAVLFALRRD